MYIRLIRRFRVVYILRARARARASAQKGKSKRSRLIDRLMGSVYLMPGYTVAALLQSSEGRIIENDTICIALRNWITLQADIGSRAPIFSTAIVVD